MKKIGIARVEKKKNFRDEFKSMNLKLKNIKNLLKRGWLALI